MKRLAKRGPLAGEGKALTRGTDKEKPPRRNPGGMKEPNRWASAFDRVAALFVLGLGGGDRQPHLLAQGAGEEAPDRMCLPAGGFPEFLQGGAAGAPQQVEDLGGLAARPGAGCFLGRLGRRGACVGLLGRGGHVGRPGRGRRHVWPVWGNVRLFVGRWLPRPRHRPRHSPFLLACRLGQKAKLAKGRRWERMRPPDRGK